MTTTEMTLSVRNRLNALDASRYRQLKQPIIDWSLNEAQELLIQSIFDPSVRGKLKVESGQRTVDDLREITVNQKPAEAIPLSIFDTDSYAGSLPEDYRHYLRGYVTAKKGKCEKRIRLYQAQIDDEFEEDPMTKSSFEWEEVNFHFLSQGLIRAYTDGTFTLSTAIMDYIRRPKYIHAAKNFAGGSYKTVNGQLLTGEQNCELAEHTHSDIVMIAVAILTDSLRIRDLQQKFAVIDKFYNI
ncbi:MAG: hypothetical protein H6546_02940 [Chitinophagales bacterium]|nr:hypothetical protein [Chitinophagales bacterium]